MPSFVRSFGDIKQVASPVWLLCSDHPGVPVAGNPARQDSFPHHPCGAIEQECVLIATTERQSSSLCEIAFGQAKVELSFDIPVI